MPLRYVYALALACFFALAGGCLAIAGRQIRDGWAVFAGLAVAAIGGLLLLRIVTLGY